MIRTGTYQPGDRLPNIMEMARRFGVGHPTLREALKKLELIGVLKIKHGSGVYVGDDTDQLLISNPIFSGSASKKLLLDLIEARIPIEVQSAALAAVAATDEQLDHLSELLQEAGQHLDDAMTLNAINMSFHRKIALASGNTVLAQLQVVLTNLFQREQRVILNVYGSTERDHQQHTDIVDALRKRDPELARNRMNAHLNGVRTALLKWDPDHTPLK